MGIYDVETTINETTRGCEALSEASARPNGRPAYDWWAEHFVAWRQNLTSLPLRLMRALIRFRTVICLKTAKGGGVGGVCCRCFETQTVFKQNRKLSSQGVGGSSICWKAARNTKHETKQIFGSGQGGRGVHTLLPRIKK